MIGLNDNLGITYSHIVHTLALFSSLSLTQKVLLGRMSTLLFFTQWKQVEIYTDNFNKWQKSAINSVHMAPAQYS